MVIICFPTWVSSGAVVLGVLLAVITGWYVLDPILASLVALNILWSGWKVVKSSLSGLLDEAVPDDRLASMRAVISTARHRRHRSPRSKNAARRQD